MFNWNKDKRDDENEEEIMCAMICGGALFLLAIVFTLITIN